MCKNVIYNVTYFVIFFVNKHIKTHIKTNTFDWPIPSWNIFRKFYISIWILIFKFTKLNSQFTILSDSDGLTVFDV